MKFILFLSLTIGALNLYAADQKKEISYGRALDAKSGALIYFEKHTTEFRKGKIVSIYTEYFNSEKEKFADLNSSFKIHPYLPDYTFKDSRFGREDGTKNSLDGKNVEVFAKAQAGVKMKKSSIPFKKMLITGQGLHSYMNANLETLLKQEDSTGVEFLIPMNQKAYSFEIKKMSIADGKAMFKVKIKSWFLSMFAPHLKVTYEIKTKRLVVFEGPSNINSDGNKPQNVKIVYSYDEKTNQAGIDDSKK